MGNRDVEALHVIAGHVLDTSNVNVDITSSNEYAGDNDKECSYTVYGEKQQERMLCFANSFRRGYF